MPKTKTKTPSIPLPQHVDGDGMVCVGGELLWKWRAAEAESRALDATIKVKSHELDTLLNAAPEIKTLLTERQSLIGQSVRAQQEYQGVLKQIEAETGVPMKDASIDDSTGRIYLLGAGGGAPVPVQTKPRRKKK